MIFFLMQSVNSRKLIMTKLFFEPLLFYCCLCADQFETSTSPPRAYPGHLTVHRARGGGNLNVALEGWGI